MITFEQFKIISEAGFHQVKDEVRGEYGPSCFLQYYKRIPKMGFCKKCKKELASIEVGSLCFSCRGLGWDQTT